MARTTHLRWSLLEKEEKRVLLLCLQICTNLFHHTGRQHSTYIGSSDTIAVFLMATKYYKDVSVDVWMCACEGGRTHRLQKGSSGVSKHSSPVNHKLVHLFVLVSGPTPLLTRSYHTARCASAD